MFPHHVQQREVLLVDCAQHAHADMRSVLRRRDSRAGLPRAPFLEGALCGKGKFISSSRIARSRRIDSMAAANIARFFMHALQQKDKSLLEQQKQTSIPPVLRLARWGEPWGGVRRTRTLSDADIVSSSATVTAMSMQRD